MVFLYVCVGGLASVRSAVVLAAPFGDRMVLQRGMVVPVWGTADALAEVEVSFGGQVKVARADGGGRWMVKLEPLQASAENRVMRVRAGETIVECRDVLVGEVWIGAGQSNMEMGVTLCEDADKEVAAAGDPLLRLRAVGKVLAPVPESGLPTASAWVEDSPEAVRTTGEWGGFSAAAYFFARELRRQLKVPVGVVQSAWGGTRIEAWTPREAFAGEPVLKEFDAWLVAAEAGYRRAVAADLDRIAAFERGAREALASGAPLPAPPAALVHPVKDRADPTALYNAHIHPWVPYAIRGALWYQGEANVNRGDTAAYAEKMKAMVGGWRRAWGQGDFPFYFVQLAPFRYQQPPVVLAEFWEAQARAAEQIPNCGMAVTIDIGDAGDIHPRNKQEVGRRLALLALARTYGVRVAADGGPRPVAHEVGKGSVTVRFADTAGGLKAADGKALRGFEVAGEDGVYAAAVAEVRGDAVVLRSGRVPAPVRARYAWSPCPDVNVVNGAGLPLAAFRTADSPNLALFKPYRTSNPNTHRWGDGGQLTDGSWGAGPLHCFATNEDDAFPKDQVIDLGEAQVVGRVVLGVPGFGSTKTVVVSLAGEDGRFQEVGRHQFGQGREEVATLRFAPVKARQVKLSAVDHHAERAGYDPRFVFLSEVEVRAE